MWAMCAGFCVQATIGIDFLTKTVYTDDKMVRLQLWDTAGQERFRSLIPSYINDSEVVVVCYDITSRQSFENVKSWVEQARQIRGDSVTIIIVGNKIDLAEKRQVATEDGQALAEELGIGMFTETSAKVGINVKQLFIDLAQKLPGVDQNRSAANDPQAEARLGGAGGVDGADGTGGNKPAFKIGGASGAAQ